MLVRKLSDHIQQVFKWFDSERQMAYSNLYEVVKSSYYEKAIIECIDLIIDDRGSVKDKASEDLSKIRTQLFKKRQELRRIFEKVVQRLAKSGYTADIDESFSQ